MSDRPLQRFERLAVLGLGLLGGSVAVAARRRGVAGERFVEDEFVDTLDALAAVLLGPRHPEPALGSELAHEGAAFRGIRELREILAGRIHHDRVVVLDQPLLDLVAKGIFLGRKLEVHGVPPWLRARSCRARAGIDNIRDVAYSKCRQRPREPSRGPWGRSGRALARRRP